MGSNPTLVVIKWVALNGRRTCPKPCLKGRKRAGAPERRGGLLEWRNWQRKRFVPARVWDHTPPPAPKGDHAGRPGAYLNRGSIPQSGGSTPTGAGATEYAAFIMSLYGQRYC